MKENSFDSKLGPRSEFEKLLDTPTGDLSKNPGAITPWPSYGLRGLIRLLWPTPLKPNCLLTRLPLVFEDPPIFRFKKWSTTTIFKTYARRHGYLIGSLQQDASHHFISIVDVQSFVDRHGENALEMFIIDLQNKAEADHV